MRARRVKIGTLSLLAGLLLVSVSAAYAGLASASPIVTFSGPGPTPLVCTSRPDVNSITINAGDQVNLMNRTGVSASVDVGNARGVLTVADGAGVSVKLGKGQHVIRMVPDCLLTLADAEPVTVTVIEQPDSENAPRTGQPSGSPGVSGPPSPGGGASGSLSPGAMPPPSASDGSVAATPGLTGAAQPQAAASDSVDLGGSAGGLTLDAQQDVYDLLPFLGDDDPDDHGGRLLAVIAAICVSGVTVAIIRAIVAQRINTPF